MSKIIVITDGVNTEYWLTLTELCKAKDGVVYSSIKGKDFPFTYKGIEFKKVAYREGMGVVVNRNKFISCACSEGLEIFSCRYLGSIKSGRKPRINTGNNSAV